MADRLTYGDIAPKLLEHILLRGMKKMATPTKSDPLGQRPDPASVMEALETVIDNRIELRMRGRARAEFDGVSDIALVHELLARGWAVFRPASEVHKEL